MRSRDLLSPIPCWISPVSVDKVEPEAQHTASEIAAPDARPCSRSATSAPGDEDKMPKKRSASACYVA
jgi:hypothetical protein